PWARRGQEARVTAGVRDCRPERRTPCPARAQAPSRRAITTRKPPKRARGERLSARSMRRVIPPTIGTRCTAAAGVTMRTPTIDSTTVPRGAARSISAGVIHRVAMSFSSCPSPMRREPASRRAT
ncbi:MAG: hypothetical protein ACK559_29110, partial [bacterium]